MIVESNNIKLEFRIDGKVETEHFIQLPEHRSGLGKRSVITRYLKEVHDVVHAELVRIGFGDDDG